MTRARFHEPSLVPLADMLTNTVGIVVFILIFTVLTAGGAVVTKRLPMEHRAESAPVAFVCAGGRLTVPHTDEAFFDRFREPLGKRTRETLAAWNRAFNEHRVEDDDFIVTGEADDSSVVLVYSPRDGAGDTLDELSGASSRLHRTLGRYTPDQRFAYFVVADDSIDVFVKARELVTELGYSYGWMPIERGRPLKVGFSGSGGQMPTPQ